MLLAEEYISIVFRNVYSVYLLLVGVLEFVIHTGLLLFIILLRPKF
jgi:hypothetical protein